MKTPEEYLEEAKNHLAIATGLASDVSPERAFLERMAVTDRSMDHDGSTCGVCHYLHLNAQVARDLLRAEIFGKDVIKKWSKETEKRWQESKFYKLWQEEVEAGRDPEEAFRQRGWEA